MNQYKSEVSGMKIYALVKKKDGRVVKQPIDAKSLQTFKNRHPLMPASYDKFKKHGSIWTSK